MKWHNVQKSVNKVSSNCIICNNLTISTRLSSITFIKFSSHVSSESIYYTETLNSFMNSVLTYIKKRWMNPAFSKVWQNLKLSTCSFTKSMNRTQNVYGLNTLKEKGNMIFMKELKCGSWIEWSSVDFTQS